MKKNYRYLFYGIDEPIELKDGTNVIPINFDNGATTPPMKCTLKAIKNSAILYGPIARGAGYKGDYCTKKYEEAREDILDFFNLKNNPNYTVIYTKTTTEGLNILANVLIKNKSDKVLTTRMEHHANDLPWRYTSNVEYVEVDKLGRINLCDIENSLIKNKGLIKYISITGASNVTGYINDIHQIAKLAHKYNAKIIVDAAQLVAHKEIDMNGNSKEEQIDFLVFSSHKAYSPFGCGAIVGLKEDLSNTNPFLKGGGCVDTVFDNNVIWNTPPSLLEAGSPNFLGIMAMVATLNKLKTIGFDNIFNHEKNIKDYLITEMKKIPNVILYGDVENTEDRLGVITFNLKNMPYYEVSEKLADIGAISSRYAKFCAHPYVNRLLGINDELAYLEYIKCIENNVENPYGMVRISLGLYNTMEEAKKFINVLKQLST